MHGAALGEGNSRCALGAQEGQEDLLLGVIRARRVSRGGADAAVLFANHLRVCQVLCLAESEEIALALVHELRERLSQPVP